MPAYCVSGFEGDAVFRVCTFPCMAVNAALCFCHGLALGGARRLVSFPSYVSSRPRVSLVPRISSLPVSFCFFNIHVILTPALWHPLFSDEFIE